MPPLSFDNVVTLNQNHAHAQCVSLQLNRWLVDGASDRRSAYWQDKKGGPAAENSECGKSGGWGACTQWNRDGKPAPLRDIVRLRSILVAVLFAQQMSYPAPSIAGL